MFEVIFLIVLGMIWMGFASLQDLKSREVANWLNFSLIIFALGFRFFYSLFEAGNFMFFYQGLIGLGIFLVLGNALYYSRMFAGGDAKLMIALGTVLPFSNNFFSNLWIFVWWFFIFLFVGGIYGLFWAGSLAIRNKKKFTGEFRKIFKRYRNYIIMVNFFGLFAIVLGFSQLAFLFLGAFIFISPYLFVFAKAIDDCCMVKNISTKNLTEGDWLYRNVKVGKKIIKAKWEGVSKEEIKLLQKKKSVKIREGIPFVPVFFISFLIIIYFYFKGF